jgi:hypothetical protein
MEFRTRVTTLRAWIVARLLPTSGYPPAMLVVDEDGCVIESAEIEWLLYSVGLSHLLPAPFSSHEI